MGKNMNYTFSVDMWSVGCVFGYVVSNLLSSYLLLATYASQVLSLQVIDVHALRTPLGHKPLHSKSVALE
jgi:hypothetical protein